MHLTSVAAAAAAAAGCPEAVSAAPATSRLAEGGQVDRCKGRVKLTDQKISHTHQTEEL